MIVFKIKGDAALEAKYQGAGMAIGAAVGDRLVDFHYLSDVFDIVGEEDEVTPEMLSDPKLGPIVQRMHAQGEVYVGMCSCYEFCVL